MTSSKTGRNCFWHAELLGKRSGTLELNGTSGTTQCSDAGGVEEALVIVECVCVVDGWQEQPHLARARPMRLLGGVRLHTCGAFDKHAHKLNQPSPHKLRSLTRQHGSPALHVTRFIVDCMDRHHESKKLTKHSGSSFIFQSNFINANSPKFRQ